MTHFPLSQPQPEGRQHFQPGLSDAVRTEVLGLGGPHPTRKAGSGLHEGFRALNAVPEFGFWVFAERLRGSWVRYETCMERLQPERACDWWSWFRPLARGLGSLDQIKLRQDPQVRGIVANRS